MPSLDDRLAVIGDALELGAAHSAQRRRLRRHTARLAAIVAVALVAIVGSALAASSLLGTPAPPGVQAAIDEFYPADPGDSLAPAPGGATVVATYGDDVLYRLPARDGVSICVGIVLAHQPKSKQIPGEGCVAPLGGPGYWLPIGIHVEESGDTRLQQSGVRQLIFGKLIAPAGSTFWIEPQGEAPQRITPGLDGFFLIERTLSPQASAQHDPATSTFVPTRFVLKDADGAQLDERSIPFLRPGASTTP